MQFVGYGKIEDGQVQDKSLRLWIEIGKEGWVNNMKIFNRLKTDAKIIMRNLQDTNDSLINTVVEYQDIIFDQKETIQSLHEVIKGQADEIKQLKQEIENLKTDGDKCDR